MKIYTLTELEAEGIEGTKIKTEFKVNCFDKTFVRVSDVPKRFKSKALDSCREYESEGLDCFVVETPLFFSVWKEERSTASKIPTYSAPVSAYGTISAPAETRPAAPVAEAEGEESPGEATKKYRGVEVNRAPMVIPLQPKPGRKYRGIDYS